MKARHRQSTTKEVKWANKIYKIGPEWMSVDNIGLFEKLSRYPQDFDTICYFDYKKLKPVKNKITIKKNIILTSDKFSIKKLEKMPFIFRQAKKETGEHVFRIMDYNESNLSSYADYESTVNVLVYRRLGGLGDIIMTFPIIEYTKKKNPNHKITYSCPEEFLCLAENNPFIDNLIPFGVGVTKKEYDIVVDLTADCIKYEMKHQPNVELNRSEIFMKSVGFDPKETPRPKLYLSDDELCCRPLGLDCKQIAIVLESNANIRTWEGVYEFRDELLKDKTTIVYEVCKGKPSNYKETKPPDQTVKYFDHSLREIASMFHQCDLVIGPDTGPMHMASALNIPTLWLFTHIDGSIRTKNYDPDITHFVQGNCNFV
jgi:hypothetical protein